MRMKSAFLATMSVALLAVPLASRAQSSGNEESRAAEFLVGTWQCADTVGEHAGSYTVRVTKALNDRWLRERYQWQTTAGSQALSGEYFFSFDPRVKKWIRIGAMNDGMYFSMTGVRQGNDWTFGYALPGPGTAVYTRKSDTEYTVLGPTYSENGKLVTEHHGCHKMS
ncbi:MAG: hypothetical protein ACREMS_01620 [Gemmatimonadaceae bacterium]